jgi:hypothetical protein
LHSDYVYPVNIGNPDEITIKDFAEEIINYNQTKKNCISVFYQKMIHYKGIDITKARKN